MLTEMLGWHENESCAEMGEDRMTVYNDDRSPQLAGFVYDSRA